MPVTDGVVPVHDNAQIVRLPAEPAQREILAERDRLAVALAGRSHLIERSPVVVTARLQLLVDGVEVFLHQLQLIGLRQLGRDFEQTPIAQQMTVRTLLAIGEAAFKIVLFRCVGRSDFDPRHEGTGLGQRGRGIESEVGDPGRSTNNPRPVAGRSGTSSHAGNKYRRDDGVSHLRTLSSVDFFTLRLHRCLCNKCDEIEKPLQTARNDSRYRSAADALITLQFKCGADVKTTLVVLLTTSIAINVVLVVRVAVPQASEPVRESVTAIYRDAGTAADPIAAADEVSKLALLLELERKYLAGADSEATVYWANPDSAGQLQFRDTALNSIRAELVARLGTGVLQDELFTHLFRPLDPQFSFLSSAQQLAVQELKRERNLALQQSVLSTSTSTGFGQVDASATRQAQEKYQGGLTKLLDDDLLFEFEVRDSSVAHELRASGVTFSEQEFRHAFSVMRELRQGDAGIDATLRARDELRSILGERRFAQLWSSQDPVMARLQGASARLAVEDVSMQAVYEALNRFEDRKMQAVQLADVDPIRSAEELDRLRDEERRVVSGIVGDDIADELLRARAIESYQLFGGSRVGG